MGLGGLVVSFIACTHFRYIHNEYKREIAREIWTNELRESITQEDYEAQEKYQEEEYDRREKLDFFVRNKIMYNSGNMLDLIASDQDTKQ